MTRFEFAAVGFAERQFHRAVELRLGFLGGFGFEFRAVAAPAEEEKGRDGGDDAEDDCGNDDAICGADGELGGFGGLGDIGDGLGGVVDGKDRDEVLTGVFEEGALGNGEGGAFVVDD